MIGFILGISLTLNIVFIVIFIVAYKKVISNLSFIKPKIERNKYEELFDKWKL